MTSLRARAVPRNRRIRQRRRLRSVLPAPQAVMAAARRGLRRAAPASIALLGAGVVFAAAWLGVRWLHSSPRFALLRIDVEGNTRVTRDDILRRAGIAMGQNVFTLQ